jgi:hypothetical protein
MGQGSQVAGVGSTDRDIGRIYQPYSQQSQDQRAQMGQILSQSQNRQAPTPYYGQNMTAAQLGSAAQVGTPQLGPGATMQAAQLGPAAQTSAAQAQFGGIDQGQAAARQQAQQGQLANMQMQAAQGGGPSLAEGQIGRAVGQSIAAQQAMAASGRGNAGTAQRIAAQQAGQIQAQGAAAAGQQRIQEQQAAQAQLGQTLATARGQNLDMATQGAQMGLQNQQYNAAARNAANLSNQQAQNQFALAQAGYGQEAAGANQNAANNFALQQAALGMQGQLANQGALNQFAMANQQATNAAMSQNQQLNQQTNLARLQAQMQQQQLNDEQVRAMMGGQVGALQNDFGMRRDLIGIQSGVNQYNAGANDRGNSSIGSMIGGAASIGLMALSDERAKTDVTTPSKARIGEFLSTIGAHEYRYKDPSLPGAGAGRYLSPMAQELEQSEIGRSMVEEGPDGFKRVNYGKGLGAILATAAHLNERLSKLEGKKAA